MGSSINLTDIGMRIPHEDEHFHRQTVADLLHRQTLNFPGAQPVSFARKHLDELQQTDYFMCEKTDGIRCLLFLTQIIGDGGEVIEAQFLIDRKNDYYYIPRDALHLPRPDDFASFHTGTLLDGELVRQRKNGRELLSYLIFDLLAIDNEDVMSKPFDKRLARIDAFIAKPLRAFAKQYPQDVAAQPFQVEMKGMEFPYGMEMMFRDKIPNLPHGNDGLIFTCKGTPYVAGTDQHILKWKPPQENTIDFRLILGDFPTLEDEDGVYEDWDAKPDMELHVNHGGREGYKYFAALNVTDTEWEAMKSLNQIMDGRIIECFRDPVTKHWKPKVEPNGAPRFRDDKQDANHITVVDSVIESIQDAVSEKDLIGAAMDIKRAFKARQAAREKDAKRAAEAEDKRRQEGKAREEEARRAAEVDDGPTYED